MIDPHGDAGRRFVLVAGETSGDALGADLIESLRRRDPQLEVAGIGGPRMAAAGMDCWYEADELAVMGLTEGVLGHLPRLLSLRRAVARRTVAWGADAFIGIDAPDFNLGLEKRLRRGGVPTIQYVCPSVWAWRRKRAARLGESADLVLALFPFEPEILAPYDVRAEFVGHPLADRIEPAPDCLAARQRLGLARDGATVALLPGSRRSEIARIGPELARAAGLLAARRPTLRFLSPTAGPAMRQRFEECLAEHAPGVVVRLYDGRADDVLAASDVAVVASGTATLEAVLAGTPMVVVYRIAASTHFLVHALGWLEVDQYSLPNALAGERLVTELMQGEFRAESVAAATLALLENPERRALLRERFAGIHAELRRGASERAAAAVSRLLAGVGS